MALNPSSQFTTFKKVTIANIELGVSLPSNRVELLRKTVSAIGGSDDDLLHNHRSRDKVIYRYPLVQYKSLEGRAAILGIGEDGSRSLEKLLENEEFTRIFSENGLTGIEKEHHELQLYQSSLQNYELHNYIALNQNNLERWQTKPSLAARAALLETCIVGHILKFASAIRWQLPPKSLQVELLDFRAHTTHAFDNPFLAFETRFRANISLPDFIGLGKAVSHGFGVLQAV